MKKIFALAVALLTLVSCNMDFYSSASMTSAQLKENPASAVYTTDGIYALFKDALPYNADSGTDDNVYIRHYFQLAESRGDNMCISAHSTDPFLGPYMYEDVDNTKNKYYLWWMAYKIIYAANSNIDAIDPSADKTSSHLVGENYFFRALCHLNMVSLFALPYSAGRDNPGVPLRIGMDYSTTTRATVGQVYDAVVEDLKQAATYMDAGTPRGDASYVSATAARALLSRVYLNMGMDDECIDLCENHLMNKAPKEVTSGYDLAKYPTQTWASGETIWCVHLIYPADLLSDSATLGAMYYKDGDENAGTNRGWGEWYWNDELIELFNRYPADKRFSTYFCYEPMAYDPTKDDGTKKMVCFPSKPKTGDYLIFGYALNCTADANGDYSFTWEGNNYKAVKTTVNGYTRYFIDANLTGDASYCGGKTPAYIRANVDEATGIRGGTFPRYYNTKYSFQDGQPTFSSPVMLRWGEVVLNLAEAYAHKGDVNNALKYVNIIRQRAGIAAADDFTAGNMANRGYDDVLDVVLDERRMELCFEGHRLFDLQRNRRKLDRRYPGYHDWCEIEYNDKRMALLIPADEINASHIAQNPR